jgi:hypothetical protein
VEISPGPSLPATRRDIVADTPERLRELEDELRALERDLTGLERKKAAGLELSGDEQGRFGKLPEMIAAKNRDIAGVLRGLGWDH